MSKRGKGGKKNKPSKRKPWPRPPWFPAHWNYDPELLPSREQALAQLAEHEKLNLSRESS